jgi:hypothetical protein
VNAHSIAGLIVLNLYLLVVGVAVLFGIRGWESWSELLRLSGFAYMLGVAAIGVILVIELVAGLDVSLLSLFATGLAVVAIAVFAGRAFGRSLPRGRTVWGHVSLTASIFGAMAIVYSEGLFRSGRLAGLYEFDGWAFWVPKGKAIYFFGGLDHRFFAELPGPSYPPLVPAFEATAFEFMGSADAVTLHLQFWFFFVGFLAAVIGLLSPRVPPLLLWPPILLVAVAPHVLDHALQEQGDFVLDEFFALAALLVGLWLIEERPWQLAGATLFSAAAMSTKREGYILVACIGIAALAASSRRMRVAWPRLLVAAAIGVASTLPWRVYLNAHDLSSGGAEAGGVGLFTNLDRAWPSLRLAVSTMFDYDIWLIIAPVMLLAILAAAVAGATRLAAYASLVFGLAIAAFAWVTWAFPSLPITKEAALNPIVRLTGSLALASTVLIPPLLASAWRSGFGWDPVKVRILPWGILLVPAIAYPVAAAADGGTRFPHRAECVHPAKSERNLEAVFGRFSSRTKAAPVLRHALEVGFEGIRIEPDGCGLLKVALPGIPTLQVGRDFIAEADRVGFNVRLEHGKP